MPKTKVYSVGHSTRTLPELIQLLRRHQVKVLVDVRRFPRSRKVPHSNKENLEVELPKGGLTYVWMGESLGGFRRGGYERHMETPDFQRGLQELLAIARAKTAAIMCAERLWFRCHRRYISTMLAESGSEVVHIVDERRTYPHKAPSIGRTTRPLLRAKKRPSPSSGAGIGGRVKTA